MWRINDTRARRKRERIIDAVSDDETEDGGTVMDNQSPLKKKNII